MRYARGHYAQDGAVCRVLHRGGWLGGRDAFEGKGPQRRPQRRLGRRLEEVAEAVGGGYCRLQMPLGPALAVRGTVAGHRLGALEGGGYLPPFQCIPGGGGGATCDTWDARCVCGGVIARRTAHDAAQQDLLRTC